MDIFSKTIILNSRSPRRKQILEAMGLSVQVVNASCEETYPDTLTPNEIALYLAEKKASAYAREISENEILVCADTIVVYGNKVLGKPKDEKQAFEMLSALSGKEHNVITGCVVKNKTDFISFTESTKVVFKHLDPAEIEYYIQKHHPFDKAGAYGIQEWIGMTGITGIEGDFYNVMGLPASRVWTEISKIV